MLPHALSIIVNELIKHLGEYGPVAVPSVELGNISEGFRASVGGPGVSRDVLCLQVVNIKEEKALKNLPNFTRDDVSKKVLYENPPVFLNFQILIVATHASYASALMMLSRAIRFFQMKNTFTENNVAPSSITTNAPINILDRLDKFKLIFDLYSPAMEEVNHLWGTLGGKQYPFVLYTMRMLDLQFHIPPQPGPLVITTEARVDPKQPVSL